RALGYFLGANDQFAQQPPVGAKDLAAVLRVRAGGIQLIGDDAALRFVQRLDDGDVVFDFIAEDIGDDAAGRIPGQWRQLGFKKCFDADILQSDGVDHASGGLDDARSLIAGHRLARKALGDESADAVEGDDLFKLNPVGEGSARRDDRTAQLDAGEADFHVWLHGCGFSFGVFAGIFPDAGAFAPDALLADARVPRRVRTGI